MLSFNAPFNNRSAILRYCLDVVISSLIIFSALLQNKNCKEEAAIALLQSPVCISDQANTMLIFPHTLNKLMTLGTCPHRRMVIRLIIPIGSITLVQD